jgi:hypothetical protein
MVGPTDAAKVSGLKLHLKNDAREWLRDQDITNWTELRELFLCEFGVTKKTERDSLSKLIHVKQRNQESLIDYVQRFKKLVRQHQRETSQDKALTVLKEADLKRKFLKGIAGQSQRREIRRANAQTATLKDIYEYVVEYWRDEAGDSEDASSTEPESVS